MNFDVFKFEAGKYLNSPALPVPAGNVEADSAEQAAIIAMYRVGTSQIAVVPHDDGSRPYPPE